MRATLFTTAILLIGLPASAVGIDEACQDLADQKPDDYDEQQQQDFLANYYALGSSFSAVHAPIPHEPGRGMIGAHVNGLVPLPCRRRFALDWQKTEDTNKSPVLPTITASYAFKTKWDAVVPYAELGFLAPIPVAGTRNLVFQSALGIGFEVTDELQLGARAHATVQRTVGDIATPIAEGDPIYEDLYLGSTLGIQAMAGYAVSETVTPYVMFGLMDASTFFYVADSGVVANNLHPYLGPEYAIGSDFLFEDKIRLGVEYYAAPGGNRTLDGASSVDGFGAYGRIHTIRLRVGLEL